MFECDLPRSSARRLSSATGSALMSLVLVSTLGACDDRKGRMLALASISQCDNTQPTLIGLMNKTQRASLRDSTSAYMATAVADTCSEGATRLRRFYPDHPCLPFMESAVSMAKLANQHFDSVRPLTSADLSASRLAQNRAACAATHLGLMGVSSQPAVN